MDQDLKSLAEAARQLSAEDKADLVDELVVELGRSSPDWFKAWSDEAGRRWGEHIASGDGGVLADDALRDVATRLAKHRRAK